jgi:hypothetical protein
VFFDGSLADQAQHSGLYHKRAAVVGSAPGIRIFALQQPNALHRYRSGGTKRPVICPSGSFHSFLSERGVTTNGVLLGVCTVWVAVGVAVGVLVDPRVRVMVGV